MSERNQEGGGLALASMVLGIIGLVAWFLPMFGLPISINGLILGVFALKSKNSGKATAGIVLSVIGLVLATANAAIGAYLGFTGQLFGNF